jgi:Fe-S oxidoreductase
VFVPGVTAQLVFILLLVASSWIFFRTLWRRLGVKKTPASGLPHDRLVMRLRRVFAEVLLQSRVIGDRPLVGVLHAFVMWGFLAFAWVNVQNLWVGLSGLEQAQESHGWYGTFAAVWAVVVFIGIAGLAFRRFVLRPKVLGPLSATSAIVAALIALLMVTYVLGWGVLKAPDPAWKVNWWLHTLSFYALLVVIPQSKHLHLVLAPFGVFFRPATTSGIRALRTDTDLGMIRFDDLTFKDVLDVNACVECGRCTQVCPANLVGKSLDPKQVILSMQRGLHGNGELVAGTESEVRSGTAWVSEEDLFQCFSCGACEEACPVGIEHVGSKILDLRRGLVSEGRITNEKVGSLFVTMERSPHNPWGLSHDARLKFIEAEQFPIFDGSQEWLFWLGCGNAFDPHGREVARAMRKLLDAAEVSWGVLEREMCCGDPARRAGNEVLFLEFSEKLIETFRRQKVKRVVTCCPHCVTTFDVDYRQLKPFTELGIEVLHHSRFIARVLDRLPLARREEPMTFHDPCYLARAQGVTEEPRAILRACGAAVKEMEHHKKRTLCCGAGGAQLYIADDKADAPGGRVNHKRFAEVIATSAPVVAVACPYCPIMLQDAANFTKRDDVAIRDIAEIVASRLTQSKRGCDRPPLA